VVDLFLSTFLHFGSTDLCIVLLTCMGDCMTCWGGEGLRCDKTPRSLVSCFVGHSPVCHLSLCRNRVEAVATGDCMTCWGGEGLRYDKTPRSLVSCFVGHSPVCHLSLCRNRVEAVATL